MAMFGIPVQQLGNEAMGALTSGSDVNVLIGLSGGLRGSVVLGLSEAAALDVVGRMMGGMSIVELDEMGKSALSELGNMLFGTALGHLEAAVPIELSPPTLITGRHLRLLISQVKSSRLSFSLGQSELVLSYCTE